MNLQVSRDLQYIKHEAKIKIEMYLREDILFEYVRYMAGSNEVITRDSWKLFKSVDTTTREKTQCSIMLNAIIQSNLRFIIRFCPGTHIIVRSFPPRSSNLWL